MLAKEGVFIFKKIISVFIFLGLIVPIKIHATSHQDFQEIILPSYSFAKLLEEYNSEELNGEYKLVKRKAFGWSIRQLNDDVKVKYVGNTIFSKANNTNRELSFIYTFEEEDFVESSVSVEGDIGIDISGKVKVISGSLDAKVRKEIGSKTQKTTIENTRTTLVIPPKRKLTVVNKGEAYLNTGVACYYFLGIRFKKGAWEYIDVISEYYDYYEETI